MELSFSSLRMIQRQEKQSSRLQELDPDFYKLVFRYLHDEEKRYTEYLSSMSSVDAVRVDNLRKVIEDIIHIRTKKILLFALETAKGNEYSLPLTPEERLLFENIVSTLKYYLESLKTVDSEDFQGFSANSTEESSSNYENSSSQEVEEKDEQPLKSLLRIKITNKVPQFEGLDGKVYGPYEPGSIVELPKEIADLIISWKLGELVEGD